VSVGRIIEGPDCLAEGAAWLAARDPRLAAALAVTGPLPLRRSKEGFGTLLSVILGQQVSRAAADAIWRRLEAAGMTTPAAVAGAGEEALRALGLSRPKVRHVRALAAAGIDYGGLRAMGDEAVVTVLTGVPGVGRWTAEVYAITALGRADVLAAGDLALREGVRQIYDMESRPSEGELRRMAQDWSPWRGVAARLFWAWYARGRGPAR
jgi:DNA-3-methyladenine glycosylase II